MDPPMPEPLPNPTFNNRLGGIRRGFEQPKMQPRIEKLTEIRDFNTMSITKGKRRSKVGKKLTKVANIFRKKGNKRSPDFK